MKVLSFIYSGYYYLFQDSKLSTKPNFSAWGSCTLASIFYMLAVLAIVGSIYKAIFPTQNIPFGIIAIVFGLTIGLLSDWNIRHTWFGATHVEMSGRRRTLAKTISIFLLMGSWLAFICAELAVNTWR